MSLSKSEITYRDMTELLIYYQLHLGSVSVRVADPRKWNLHPILIYQHFYIIDYSVAGNSRGYQLIPGNERSGQTSIYNLVLPLINVLRNQTSHLNGFPNRLSRGGGKFLHFLNFQSKPLKGVPKNVNPFKKKTKTNKQTNKKKRKNKQTRKLSPL